MKKDYKLEIENILIKNGWELSCTNDEYSFYSKKSYVDIGFSDTEILFTGKGGDRFAFYLDCLAKYTLLGLMTEMNSLLDNYENERENN